MFVTFVSASYRSDAYTWSWGRCRRYYQSYCQYMKLLLVEDDHELRGLLTRTLEVEHYIVEQATTFSEARERILLYQYDCILLDLGLPGGDGLELLRLIKKEGKDDSVLIISARGTLDDRVEGLELGADDYLPKPFHTVELTARIKSIIRRRQRAGQDEIILANLRLLPDEYRAMVDDQLLELSRKEYDILHYFALRAGRLINKQMMAESVWGDYIDQIDSFDFIYAQIKNLRKKLNQAGARVQIKAVYGVGYKLLVE